jgi:hypothetical protein
VEATFRLNESYADFVKNTAAHASFVGSLVTFLGLSTADVQIDGISQGSTIVRTVVFQRSESSLDVGKKLLEPTTEELGTSLGYELMEAPVVTTLLPPSPPPPTGSGGSRSGTAEPLANTEAGGLAQEIVIGIAAAGAVLLLLAVLALTLWRRSRSRSAAADALVKSVVRSAETFEMPLHVLPA